MRTIDVELRRATDDARALLREESPFNDACSAAAAFCQAMGAGYEYAPLDDEGEDAAIARLRFTLPDEFDRDQMMREWESALHTYVIRRADLA